LTGSSAASTPGVKVGIHELEADEGIHDARGKVYQTGSARPNYVGPDRPEIQFSTKECCRRMSQPTEVAMQALKRVGRFVVGRPRLVMSMKFEEQQAIDVYVDSDYAGCPRTRKSTSGGCVMMGSHLIKAWSSTQNNAISLSSGEAELYSIVKGVGQGIGIRQFLEDLGVSAAMRVHTDSAAAQGICKRVGLGTQRHIVVNSLWVQEKLRKKEFSLYKIKGEDNPADLMTKHLPRDKMIRALKFMGAAFRDGRPSVAPMRKEHEHIL
ncbi:MAG: Ty1/Copia family ribonuclease HI, partial [Dehalococcoidia bacterium]|nr:Ty1/Copia family ribonuclease HI [Dehalococcoidia bacterium]